ncbi:MAG: hypothetical protein ACOH1Y_11745 [Propionicimonas sp.]
MSDTTPKPSVPTGTTVHVAHCCLVHGCKYGDPDCPVKNRTADQQFPCVQCPSAEDLHDSRRALSDFDRVQRAVIKGWDQEQLLAAAKDCGEEDGPGHCWRCAAFDLYTTRKHAAEAVHLATLPGAALHWTRYFNGEATDLQPGDGLQWWPYPGSEYFREYVVVQDVSAPADHMVTVTLHRTNVPDPLFTVNYPADMQVAISRGIRPA